jgi:mannosyltransferase
MRDSISDQAADFPRGQGPSLETRELRLQTFAKASHPRFLAGVVVIAAALFLYRLGFQDLWLDEALSVAIASSRGQTFIDLAFRRQPTAFLYYILLHFWLFLGDTRFVARLLSAVFALGALPVVFFLGTRLFNRRVGLTAALLMAGNVSFVAYAQEARTYTLTMFLAVISWILLLEEVRRPSRGTGLSYIIVTVLTVFSHTFALLILPAQVAVMFLFTRDRALRKHFLTNVLAVTLCSAPAIAMVAGSGIAENFDWIPKLSLREVSSTFAMFSGAALGPLIARRWLEAIYAGALVLALKASVSGQDPAKSRAIAAAGIAATAPIVILIGGSLIRPMYVTRYVLICLPFFALLAAAGLSEALPRSAFTGAIIMIIALSIATDTIYYREGGKPQNWRQVVAYMSSSAKAGDDVALVPSYCRLPFDYALRDSEDLSHSLSILYPKNDAPLFDRNPELTSTMGSSEYQRLWVVTCQIDLASDVLRALKKRSQGYSTRNFPGLSAFLFQNVGGGSEENVTPPAHADQVSAPSNTAPR